MATLVSALDTEFTPAVGDFNIQATGGVASLLRKNAAGAAFALVHTALQGAFVVSNPIAGAVYKFSAPSSSTVVQADQ